MRVASTRVAEATEAEEAEAEEAEATEETGSTGGTEKRRETERLRFAKTKSHLMNELSSVASERRDSARGQDNEPHAVHAMPRPRQSAEFAVLVIPTL
jgi:hypothetical protein